MESEYKKLKPKEEKEAYERAHAAVLNETQILWQLSQVFLLANSFLAGFIGTNFIDGKIKDSAGVFALSFIGFIISVLWWLSYTRTSNYYKFRIAQAKQREPKNWKLYKRDGELFSQGIKIEIEGKSYGFGMGKLSSLWIIRILAWVFIIFYCIIGYLYFPRAISVSLFCG